MEKLYFDFCASTPLYPEALEVLSYSTEKLYENPSSTHLLGRNIKSLVEHARHEISELLNIKSTEIIFTSGATEANNLAIIGLVRAMQKSHLKNPHIISTETEHSSVYNCCKSLEEEGIEITFLPVNENGLINIRDLENSIKHNTVLVSVMHVNNETGSIQPILEIGNLIKDRNNMYFHVDGVQAVGKLPLNLDLIDLYTISGHKIGGPKGIGALIIKEHVPLSPIIYGGDQENGIRPGTTNVPGVLSLTKALNISLHNQKETWEHLNVLNIMLRNFVQSIPELVVNSPENSVSSPHILNVSYPGIPSAISLSILEKKSIVASSQSACSSYNKTSRVLMAMYGNYQRSSSSIRFSFHESVRLKDMDDLFDSITHMVKQIKMNKFV